MFIVQKQQLFGLPCKARFLKGLKTQDTGKRLEGRITMLKAKLIAVAIKAYLQTKCPKAKIAKIPPEIKKKTAPGRAYLKVDA